jgi:hypothetical protein
MVGSTDATQTTFGGDAAMDDSERFTSTISCSV